MFLSQAYLLSNSRPCILTFFFFRKSVISDHAEALGGNLQALIFSSRAFKQNFKMFEIKVLKQ